MTGYAFRIVFTSWFYASQTVTTLACNYAIMEYFMSAVDDTFWTNAAR